MATDRNGLPKVYTIDDLEPVQIGPLLQLFAARSSCFPDGRFTPLDLCLEACRAAWALGVGRVLLVRDGEWWGVLGDSDWLADVTPSWRAVFETIVEMPNAFRWIRPENWLVAFAESVVVADEATEEVVLGTDLGCPLNRNHDFAWKRAVFFKPLHS
jgi:hypothetical protein